MQLTMILINGKALSARVTVPRAMQPAVRARGRHTHCRRVCAQARGSRDCVMFSFDKSKTADEDGRRQSLHQELLGCPESDTGTCSATFDRNAVDDFAGFILRRDHDPTGCPDSETGMCNVSMDEQGSYAR